MTGQEIPRNLIRAFVPQGYFIPAYLIWLYLPLYGKEAWKPAWFSVLSTSGCRRRRRRNADRS